MSLIYGWQHHLTADIWLAIARPNPSLYSEPRTLEELWDVVIFRKIRKGILLSPGEAKDFMGEFRRVMLSEPRRTGIPENPPAQEMKAIWKEAP